MHTLCIGLCCTFQRIGHEVFCCLDEFPKSGRGAKGAMPRAAGDAGRDALGIEEQRILPAPLTVGPRLVKGVLPRRRYRRKRERFGC
jgi:hypothetical protein